jgi:type II secretory pathway pseudopilin PulG
MSLMIRSLTRRLRDDQGTTLMETSVAAAVLMVAVAAIGAFIYSASTGSIFAQGQSATINDVRNTMQQIEKEVRGADALEWCAPAGSCLEVGAQTPDGAFRTVRYTHTGTVLQRAIFDDMTSTWGNPQTVIQRVTNTAGQPVFACDTQSTLLRVTIDLYIEPTPVSDPNLNVQTSLRPRNFPSVASCP